MAAKKPSSKNSKSSAKKAKTQAAPVKAISVRQTASQILQAIAAQSDVSVKEVKAVFQSANQLLHGHMIKRGSGEFVLPGLALKVIRKTKPAMKARQGRNPATGETITIAAKPKREIIRVRVLKGLKKALEV